MWRLSDAWLPVRVRHDWRRIRKQSLLLYLRRQIHKYVHRGQGVQEPRYDCLQARHVCYRYARREDQDEVRLCAEESWRGGRGECRGNDPCPGTTGPRLSVLTGWHAVRKQMLCSIL